MIMVKHEVNIPIGALRNPSGCNNGNLGMWIDKHTAEKILKASQEVVLSYWCEESILDDTELKYLKNIIKPFRNKVIFIKKFVMSDNHYEYIQIGYENIFDNNYTNTLCIGLPCFPANTMYTGMELYHEYTLEELGL